MKFIDSKSEVNTWKIFSWSKLNFNLNLFWSRIDKLIKFKFNNPFIEFINLIHFILNSFKFIHFVQNHFFLNLFEFIHFFIWFFSVHSVHIHSFSFHSSFLYYLIFALLNRFQRALFTISNCKEICSFIFETAVEYNAFYLSSELRTLLILRMVQRSRIFHPSRWPFLHAAVE